MSSPLLAADLRFACARNGHAYSALSDWDEERDPVVGETVPVADNEGCPFESKIERVDANGTIVLVIPALVG